MRFNQTFESGRVHIAGLVVMEECAADSHWTSAGTLSDSPRRQGVPGLAGIDTRALTQKLRTRGTMLGKLQTAGLEVPFRDPNQENLVAAVSVREPELHGEGGKRIVVVDCGCKNN